MMWLLFLLNIAIASEPTQVAPPQPAAEVVYNEELPTLSLQKTLNSEHMKFSNDFTYEVTPEELSEFKEDIAQLNSAELEIFKTRRRALLAQLGKILSYNKTRNSLGYVEKGKVTMVYDGTLQGEHPIDAIANAQAIEVGEKPTSELSAPQKITRRHKFIKKILNGADKFFFKNSLTAISSDEYGAQIGITLASVEGLGGKWGKYIFGGGIGFDIYIGMNANTKQMTFQIKLLREKAMKGIVGVFMPIAIMPRIGFYMRSSKHDQHNYDVTYPPMAPAYAVKTNGLAGGGFSYPITPLAPVVAMTGGLAGFIEQAMSFQAQATVKTIFDDKIARQYVRVKLGNMKSFISRIKGTIQRFYTPNIPAPFCRRYFDDMA